MSFTSLLDKIQTRINNKMDFNDIIPKAAFINPRLYKYHNPDEVIGEKYPDILDLIYDYLDFLDDKIEEYKLKIQKAARDNSYTDARRYKYTYNLYVADKEKHNKILETIKNDDGEFYLVDTNYLNTGSLTIYKLTEITDEPANHLASVHGVYEFVESDDTYDGMLVKGIIGTDYQRIIADEFTHNGNPIYNVLNITVFEGNEHYTKAAVNEKAEDLKSFTFHKCKQCGSIFRLSDNEKAWYEYKGFQLPKLCKDCRRKRNIQ